MSRASRFYPLDKDNVLYDEEHWEAMLGDLIRENPKGVDSLAVLIYEIIGILSEGPEGIEKVINTLKVGVDWIFRYSTTGRLAFTLFLYQIEGLLNSQDLPESVIGGAIARADEGLTRFNARTASGGRGKKRGIHSKMKKSTR